VLDQYLPNKSQDFDEIMKPPWQGHVRYQVFNNAYNDLCSAMTHSGLNSFGKAGNDEQNKREVASFLANVAIETAYLEASAQGRDYSSNSTDIGRGSIQLTGWSNYNDAAGYFGNPSIVSNPIIVATDTKIVWETGLWFWLHYSNPSVPAPNNCQAAVHAGDFGRTVRIIKGSCAGAETESSERQVPYKKACDILGISYGDMSCP
jgi:predicted chitinase